jgi:hypothetical protein
MLNADVVMRLATELDPPPWIDSATASYSQGKLLWEHEPQHTLHRLLGVAREVPLAARP